MFLLIIIGDHRNSKMAKHLGIDTSSSMSQLATHGQEWEMLAHLCALANATRSKKIKNINVAQQINFLIILNTTRWLGHAGK